LSTRDSLYKINKIMRNAFERVGIEFQIMPIPKQKATSTGGVVGDLPLDDSVNWLRIPMYSSINSILLKNPGTEFFKGKNAIEIGGSEGTIARMLRSLGSTVQLAPDYPRVDVENLPYQPESCDIIVLDQILEHLRHPWVAVDQVRRVLKKNGLCICTSVFIYPIHHGGNYGDYYRFSPDGFRAIFEGFNVISADGWGNAEVLRLTYNHSDRGPEGTSPVSKAEAERLGIYNHSDAMNYMMTWCIAQR
jgi:SAM-dependent methyltransferase